MSVSAAGRERLWEIDLLRTAAIVMMVVYHAAYNVDMLAVAPPLDPFTGGWRALQVACGSTFLFVTGLTLAVMNARGRTRGLSPWRVYRRHLRRAAVVLAAAVAVSAATYIALGDDYVRFGVLHCIAAAMIICPLLIPLRTLLLPLAAAVLVAGLWLEGAPRTDITVLLVVGMHPAGGAGVDWYPLLPWLAPAIAGLWAGGVLYPGGVRGAWGRHLPRPPHAAALGWPGRHSLPIYLLHQPLLVPLVAAVLVALGVEISDAAFR